MSMALQTEPDLSRHRRRIMKMSPQRQIKKMPLQDIQAELRATTGTPFRPGDRARRYLLWRQLDRLVRHRLQKGEVIKQQIALRDARSIAQQVLQNEIGVPLKGRDIAGAHAARALGVFRPIAHKLTPTGACTRVKEDQQH